MNKPLINRLLIYCRLSFLIFTIPAFTKVQAQHTGKKPNVIILFADDMRANTIHALGNRQIITPNLDKLVKNGVAFSQAYNMGGHTGAVCVSSRAMLITGQSIHRLSSSETQIPQTSTFLGQLLNASGYQTYGIGKWHNGIESYVNNFKDGDEIMFGGMTASQWEVPLNHFSKDGIYKQQLLSTDSNNRDLPGISDHVYKGKHSSEIFTEAAVKFLNSQPSKSPFFLYVAYTTPHDPRQMPQEYLNMYKNIDIPVPPNFLPEHPFNNGHMRGRDERLLGFPRKPEEVKKEIKDYYATITHLDAQIGRIMDALKKSGQEDNTVLIFAADNGLAVGQHGLMGKQNLYEHSVGVPMIWTGPGIQKNKVSTAYCYLSDIYPTLCDVLKISKPKTVDGKSFSANLSQPDKAHREKLFFSFRDFQRSVNDQRYKLIEYHVKGVRTTQLFDLKTDPWETKNLAKNPEYKLILERLRKDLVNHKNETGDHSTFWQGFTI